MPPNRTTLPSAPDWAALFDGDMLQLSTRYPQIIYQVGLETWIHENPEGETPESSEDEILALREGRFPGWWPRSFPRLQVRIKLLHQGVSHNFGPTWFEARRAGAGWEGFQNILKLLMTSAPNPFSGPIHIEILLPSGSPRGGYNGLIRVGNHTLLSGMGGGIDGDDEGWMSNEVKYLRKHRDKQDELYLRMFESSASVISASASVIAATKGTNDEAEEGGWKEAVIEIGAAVVSKFLGREPEEKEKKEAPPQIPAKQQLQIGDGNYPTEIDPAGPPSEQDGWGDGDQTDEEEIVDPDVVPEPEGVQEEKENPFDGMSADEIGSHLEAWMRQNKDKKGEIKKVGLKLAKHVL
jgi:hypothetical protein